MLLPVNQEHAVPKARVTPRVRAAKASAVDLQAEAHLVAVLPVRARPRVAQVPHPQQASLQAGHLQVVVGRLENDEHTR